MGTVHATTVRMPADLVARLDALKSFKGQTSAEVIAMLLDYYDRLNAHLHARREECPGVKCDNCRDRPVAWILDSSPMAYGRRQLMPLSAHLCLTCAAAVNRYLDFA